jgi:UDP-3-O-[3-hydroxymyristoyl] N-acetylglucosamine deacetylase
LRLRKRLAEWRPACLKGGLDLELATRQTTLSDPVSFSGVGLHSGVPASFTIRPAAADFGIAFRRTDLEGFLIPADWRYVARVSYATSLMREGVLLSTIEHLLSTLYALGVDNAEIEIDNLEVPIGDGSSRPFVKLIHEAGLTQLEAPRRYVRILRPVEVVDGGKRIAVEPYESFQLNCTTHFDHPMVGDQAMEIELTPAAYAKEIAAARTFGFVRDLDQMRDMGLIRGASLDNAICFSDDGVLNPGGLRFEDECCRHKVLDLIGDLALTARPLLGRVTAERAGHAMHIALVRKIMTDPTCHELALVEEPELTAAGSRWSAFSPSR